MRSILVLVSQHHLQETNPVDDFNDVELDDLDDLDEVVMLAGHGAAAPSTPHLTPLSQLDDALDLDEFEAPLRDAAAAAPVVMEDEGFFDCVDTDRFEAPVGVGAAPPPDGPDIDIAADPDDTSGQVNALFALWDAKVAPTLGDKVWKLIASGGLAKRAGRSHPSTRNCDKVQRLCVRSHLSDIMQRANPTMQLQWHWRKRLQAERFSTQSAIYGRTSKVGRVHLPAQTGYRFRRLATRHLSLLVYRRPSVPSGSSGCWTSFAPIGFWRKKILPS